MEIVCSHIWANSRTRDQPGSAALISWNAGLANADVTFVIASQGEMAHAMGFSVEWAELQQQAHSILWWRWLTGVWPLTRPPDANSKIQKRTSGFHAQMGCERLWWYLCLKVKPYYRQRRPRHETWIWSSEISDSKIMLSWQMPSDNWRLVIWWTVRLLSKFLNYFFSLVSRAGLGWADGTSNGFCWSPPTWAKSITGWAQPSSRTVQQKPEFG